MVGGERLVDAKARGTWMFGIEGCFIARGLADGVLARPSRSFDVGGLYAGTDQSRLLVFGGTGCSLVPV